MAHLHEINRIDEIDEITSNFEPSMDQSSQYEVSQDFRQHGGLAQLWQHCAPTASHIVATCSCAHDNQYLIPFSPCPSGDIQNSNVRTQRPENMNLLRLFDNSLFLVAQPTVYKRYGNLLKLLNWSRLGQLSYALQNFRAKVIAYADGSMENMYGIVKYFQDVLKSYEINSNVFVFESQPSTYELKRQNFSEFTFSRNYVLTQMNKVTYFKTLLLPHGWSNFQFRDEILRKFPQFMGNNEFECLADDVAAGENVVFTVDKTGLQVLMSRNYRSSQAVITGENLQIKTQTARRKRTSGILFVQFSGTGDVVFSGNQISMAYVICERCTQVQCQNCELEQLNVDLCSRLQKLYAFQNQLKKLDVRRNSQLEVLCAHQNQLAEVDLSQNPRLTWLGLRHNQISVLNLANNALLQELFLLDNNIANIDVTPCQQLRILNIENNQLTELSVENCAKLAFLLAKDNFIYALNASGCGALQEIRISSICQSFDITISKEEHTRIYFEE